MKHFGAAPCSIMAMVMALWLGCVDAADPASPPDDAFTQQRRALRHRKRRIILNNDGCNCLYFPKNLAITADNYPAQRTSPLATARTCSKHPCRAGTTSTSGRPTAPAWARPTGVG